MKAENILNSNLASKIQFVMKKFAKKRVFQNFRFIFDGIFFFETQIFQKIYYTTPHFYDCHLFST